MQINDFSETWTTLTGNLHQRLHHRITHFMLEHGICLIINFNQFLSSLKPKFLQYLKASASLNQTNKQVTPTSVPPLYSFMLEHLL